ncbi:hypothetical protein D3C80_1600730 [compost metagenome]
MPDQAAGERPYQHRHQHEVGEQQRRHEAPVAQALAQVEEGNLQKHRIHQHGNGGGDQSLQMGGHAGREQTEGDGGDHGGQVDRDLLGFQLSSVHGFLQGCKRGIYLA